ncbi:MAG: N-acetyltransferase [Desulfurellales bacterium]|nr:MAG: N-acetyltransferase [Desulfurellales bacterium]
MKAIPAGNLLPMVCEYVTERAGMYMDPTMAQALIISKDNGDMVGAVIINTYRGFDCHISAVVETPLAWRMGVRLAIAQYVFGQLGCKRATAITRIRNTKARRALEAAGFSLEGKLRLGYDGKKDALVYGILASECAYFKEV